jgi:DNA polymerase III delta prime subunit
MTDYENELFVYKYRPKTLKDIDRPLTKTLNKIVEKDTIPNFILYGQKGTGKKTLFYSFLKSRYGDFKTQCVYKEYKINTKKIEIPVFYSQYHVEIDIRTFLSHVRTILPVLIKEFAQTKNVLDNRHKLFVIHHIEDLEMQTQHTLRRILEIYMDNCRFIFICSKLNKVTHPLQSRCLIIRIPVFTNEEITKILNDINKQLLVVPKDNLKQLTKPQIESIVDKCENNIKTAVFSLESAYYGFTTDILYEEEADQLLKQIINTETVTLELYEKIDNYLYMNLYKNRCLQELIQTTFISLRKILNNDYEKLNVILKQLILYDQNMVDGSRDYMHLQAIFYYLVYYFHNDK